MTIAICARTSFHPGSTAMWFVALARCLRSFLILAAFVVGLAAPAHSAPATLTSDDIAKIVDPLMTDWLAHGGTGAVIVVTGPEDVVFAKGYGMADVEAKRPFTADQTLVRPGSISKLFTAISVMQLVDQGKLDLDRDVSDYVGFNIPTPPNGAPVTLRRLLTHTAGFEEQAKELFSARSTPRPLGDWLAKSVPHRLFPEGDVPAYSNYGFALAGYVVERISGEAFADYVDRHILEPLRMDHSTFQQPLPPTLFPLMAKGYRGPNQAPSDYFETIAASPAGALSATGEDMGRFMRALLNGGELDGARILSRARLEEMWTPSTPPDQMEAGWLGLAFFGRQFGNVEIIGHGGATLSFFSDLELFRDNELAVFASRDGYSDQENPPDVARALAERLGTPSQGATTSTISQFSHFDGVYQSSRRSDSTLFRISALLRQTRVVAHADGSLTMSTAWWPFLSPKPLKPVGGNALEIPSGRRFAAVEGAEPYLATPAQLFQPVPWFLNARWVVPALLSSVSFALATLALWPFTAAWRHWRHRPSTLSAKDRRLRSAAKLTLLLDLIVAAMVVALYFYVTADPMRINDELNFQLIAIYALAWLGVLATCVTVFVAFDFWRRGVGGVWMRLHQTALAACALIIAYVFVAFRVAGTTLQI